MSSSIYDAMTTLAEKIAAEGVPATADPRSATPPCVLVTPPGLRNDLPCAATARFTVWALAPATANLDAIKVLDTLLTAVFAVCDWTDSFFDQYALSADSPPVPAYRVEVQETIT